MHWLNLVSRLTYALSLSLVVRPHSHYNFPSCRGTNLPDRRQRTLLHCRPQQSRPGRDVLGRLSCILPRQLPRTSLPAGRPDTSLRASFPKHEERVVQQTKPLTWRVYSKLI